MAATYKKLDFPVEIYKTNPSLDLVANNLTIKKKKTLFKNGNKALIDASTGEFAGQLQQVYLENLEVDTEKFIKIYAGTIDELMALSSAGLKVFKLVYLSIMDTPNVDNVYLDFTVVKELGKWNWSQTTFISGINELLSKNILYRALGTNKYFINIGIFFNGDRVSIIKTYRLKLDHSL